MIVNKCSQFVKIFEVFKWNIYLVELNYDTNYFFDIGRTEFCHSHLFILSLTNCTIKRKY